jgi:hypothetical protein
MLMAWEHSQDVVGSAFVDILCMSTERFNLDSFR